MTTEEATELTMEQKLRQFLDSKYHNTWLKPTKGKEMDVYVRKGIRRIPNCPVLPALDVANFGPVIIMQEVQDFLEIAERIHKYDMIYFENVDSHPLIGFLVLRGYSVHPQYTTRSYACLYKILPDPNLPS